MKFVQNGLKSLLVSWTSGMPAVTGYVVHYREQNGEHNGSVTVEGSESGANITGLNPGTNYSMEIVATSSTLPSDATLKYITIGQLHPCFYITERQVPPQNKPAFPCMPLPHTWSRQDTTSPSPALSLFLKT